MRQTPQSTSRSIQPADRVDELLQKALSLHQNGRLTQAKSIYGEILAIQPANADALHFLGVIAYQSQNHQLAVNLIDQALAIHPGNAACYSHRGLALWKLNRFDDALSSYEKAIAMKPDYAEALFNCGEMLQDIKNYEAAIACYDKAIAVRSDFAQAWSNRGNALKLLRQHEAAIASYDKAITINPDYAEALSNRGVACQELNRLQEALASLDRAIAINPYMAEPWYNRGLVLDMLKESNAAADSYDRAIAINPDYAEAYTNRGLVLYELGRIGEALADHNRAIAINPDYAEAYTNRGLVLHQLRQWDAAIADYDKAISINPDSAEAYWNKSLILLLLEDYANGWKMYEWRWKVEKFAPDKRRAPLTFWNGMESVSGKTILLYSEQGFGDTIQFCRYVKKVAELGSKVILAVEQPLIGLLMQLDCVADFVVKGDSLPGFDFHCPLMSLPLAFKTTLETIPSPSGYLSADKDKVAEWAVRLGEKTKPRIGLAWSGNTGHKHDKARSIALSELLDSLPSDVHYVSLQKELRELDRLHLDSATNIVHYGDDLKDFADTSALCELMDVVISVDTAVAHLSAAMGKPTWIMVPFCPDWRWMLDRNDSPWYDSVKLYRQEKREDWQSVLLRLSDDISKHSW